VLRVVDLATGEGDGRFARIRSRMLNEITMALSEVVSEARSTPATPSKPSKRARGAGPVEHEPLDPVATAGVLVAMLAHVASHRYGFEFWGIRTNDVRRSMAHLVYWGVTGRDPEEARA
jgi:hypothetical protein